MATADTGASPSRRRSVARDRRLASITSAILGSNLVTSALGVVFWMFAARGLVPAELGQLGAATSAMMLVGALGAMGLGPLLISELPLLDGRRQRELFTVSTLAGFVVGGVLALGFGAVAGRLGETWEPVGAFTQGWLWLALGSALTAVSMVFDQAMLVVGNPQTQVWRNTVASVWKVLVLGLAMLIAQADVNVALGAWTTGLLLGALMAVRSAMARMPSPERVPVRRTGAVVREFGRRALEHQGVNYAMSISSLVMPPLIATLVTAADNGIYTTVRLATMFGFMLPYAVSVSVFARASGNDDVDEDYLRRVFWLAFGLSIAIVVVMTVFAKWTLWPFGSEYADEGVTYLRIMVLAGPLLVFKDQFIARRRIERRVNSLLGFVLISAALEVGLTVAGALSWGLTGAIVGWVLSLALQALYTGVRLFAEPGARPGTASSGMAGRHQG